MMLHPTAQATLSKSSLNGAEENRHYLRAFIHTYRDLAVLWDTSLRDYTSREKRAVAYEQLVPIYRYLKRDATVEDVKKKINTLRTNYRKELKVVECARRSGSLHTPRCWTFHELDFLRNTEKFLAVNTNYRNESFSGFSESSQTSFIEPSATVGCYSFRSMLNSPPSVSEMFQKSFGHTQRTDAQQTSPSTQPSDCQSNHQHSMPSPALSAHEVKRQRTSPAPSTTATQNPDELLTMACDYLTSQFPEEESIARTWTHKLKRMQREQRLLAEKFINEILFEGETGCLHRNSVQVNTFEPFVRFEENQSNNNNEQTQKSQSPSVHTSTSTTALVGAEPSDVTTKSTKDSDTNDTKKSDADFSGYN